MFDHRETLAYRSAQLGRQLAGRLREALTPFGLLPAQFTALAEIARAEGMTQKQLVARLGVEQPGVARTLSGLEALGWIEPRRRNGRGAGLFLTERARTVLPAAQAAAAAVDRAATRGLGRTERAQLLDRLEQLADGGGDA